MLTTIFHKAQHFEKKMQKKYMQKRHSAEITELKSIIYIYKKKNDELIKSPFCNTLYHLKY